MHRHEQSVYNRGKSFLLSKHSIEETLAGVQPERVVKYGVEIQGREYPVRQVLAEATKTPKIEWTTSNAYRILQKFGFEIHIHEV